MSESLIVLIPVVLLAMIPLLCFVGCVFSPLTEAQAYGNYEGGTVIATPNVVALWPLDDTSGTTAVELNNAFNGTYTQGPNVPYDPVNQSAAATGAVTLNQPGIVSGDKNPSNNQNPCILVDGGFVSVPFQAALNPQPPFTLEAWVVANWTANDVQNFPATRVVVASANLASQAGFSLAATPDNYWVATVGTSSGFVDAKPPAGSNQTIVLNSLYFLVVTYDGTTLTLWVNPADTSAAPYAQTAVGGFAPVTAASPAPLFIGMGRPDLPNGLFPFNGFIQDVAFYNAVLDGSTIEKHYMNGNGIQMT